MIISTFRSVFKAYVEDQVDTSWEDIALLLCTHTNVMDKKHLLLFNMMQFKSLDDASVELGRRYHYINGVKQDTYDIIPNTVRRCKTNVLSQHGIVLDVDQFMSIEQAIDKLDGIEYVLYTTFRHTIDAHRFRIVIPFSRPLLAEDILGRQDSIIETFPGVDHASFTVSQSYYFHCGHNDPIAYHNKGTMIDPYIFEYREPEVYEPIMEHYNHEFNESDQDAYKQAVVRSLRSCKGLHYAGTGNNLAVLTLVSICKSIGLSFAEYDSICQGMASPDSLLQQANTRASAWAGWKGDRIRKETRDNFIRTYGGDPIKIQRQDAFETTFTRFFTKG